MVANKTEGYCVFIDSICEGVVPSVFDEKCRPIVFETFEGAEAEIIDCSESRLAHASNEDERRIYEEDTEEFVLKVEVLEDGTVLRVLE